MKKETEIIEKCSNEITAEIEKIQTHFKNIISILKEIDYIQRTIKVNLGLFVIDADYYAPTRYFIGRRSTNDEINFHPAFGVKRFNGERCEHNLPLLLKIAEKTEKFLVETGEKISEISIPSVDKIKTFKMRVNKMNAEKIEIEFTDKEYDDEDDAENCCTENGE